MAERIEEGSFRPPLEQSLPGTLQALAQALEHLGTPREDPQFGGQPLGIQQMVVPSPRSRATPQAMDVYRRVRPPSPPFPEGKKPYSFMQALRWLGVHHPIMTWHKSARNQLKSVGSSRAGEERLSWGTRFGPEELTYLGKLARDRYVDLSRLYHPDQGGTHEQMVGLNNLYDFLNTRIAASGGTPPRAPR